MAERGPALGDRVGKVDRLVVEMEMAFVVDDLFFFGHGPARPSAHFMLTMRS